MCNIFFWHFVSCIVFLFLFLFFVQAYYVYEVYTFYFLFFYICFYIFYIFFIFFIFLYFYELLFRFQDGSNPLSGWKPSVPEGQQLELGTDEYDELEEKGLQQARGREGEREGFEGLIDSEVGVNVTALVDRLDSSISYLVRSLVFIFWW